MLESSVRLLLAMVRAKPRLALAPESRGRIAANVALFNTCNIPLAPNITCGKIIFIKKMRENKKNKREGYACKEWCPKWCFGGYLREWRVPRLGTYAIHCAVFDCVLWWSSESFARFYYLKCALPCLLQLRKEQNVYINGRSPQIFKDLRRNQLHTETEGAHRSPKLWKEYTPCTNGMSPQTLNGNLLWP